MITSFILVAPPEESFIFLCGRCRCLLVGSRASARSACAAIVICMYTLFPISIRYRAGARTETKINFPVPPDGARGPHSQATGGHTTATRSAPPPRVKLSLVKEIVF